jgi:RND family efflux transporter MFP subunit
VSISYVGDIALNEPVEVRLEGTGESLHGRIGRFSRRIDVATRTMETELEVPNDDLKLIPGMYASVVLRVHKRPGALAIPVEAVAASANPTVYLVSGDGTVSERSVTLGIETPNNFEVLGGLAAGDLVVVGSRASIRPGEKVHAKVLAASLSQ